MVTRQIAVSKSTEFRLYIFIG